MRTCDLEMKFAYKRWNYFMACLIIYFFHFSPSSLESSCCSFFVILRVINLAPLSYLIVLHSHLKKQDCLVSYLSDRPSIDSFKFQHARKFYLWLGFEEFLRARLQFNRVRPCFDEHMNSVDCEYLLKISFAVFDLGHR